MLNILLTIVLLGCIVILVKIGIILFSVVPEKKPTAVFSSKEILENIKAKKDDLFPIDVGDKWNLSSIVQGQRIWLNKEGDLLSSHSKLIATVTKVAGSTQAVLHALKDTDNTKHWNPYVKGIDKVLYDPLSSNDTVKVTLQNYNTPCPTIYTYKAEYINKYVYGKYEQQNLIRDVEFERLWKKERNGCCWYFECSQVDCICYFYLIQPLEGFTDCSMLSLLSLGSGESTKQEDILAEITSGLTTYLQLNITHDIPFITMTLTDDDVIPLEEDPDESINTDESFAVIEEQPVNSENIKDPTLLDKFKTFLNNKSEDNSTNADSVNEKSIDDKSTDRPLSSVAARLNKAKMSLNSIRKDSSEKKPSDEVDDIIHKSLTSSDTHDSIKKDPLETSKLKRAFSSFDDSAQGLQAAKPSEDFLNFIEKTRTKLKLDIGKRSLSLDGVNRSPSLKLKYSKLGARLMRKPPKPDFVFSKGAYHTGESLLEQYRDIASQVAKDIIYEKSCVSHINVLEQCEDMNQESGGWMYCGLEKEVVVLKKLFEDDITVQSYLGKGIISMPPKLVFEALKKPETRYGYDDTLKNVEVIHRFANDMCLLYLKNEISHMFKTELKDFCILQHERIEGVKYIVTQCSVDWPNCPPKADITRGKFLSSGWIIEPFAKGENLFSMVTNLSQLEVGSGKTGYIVEDFAAKQPLSIASLRQYLLPVTSSK